MNDRVDYGVTIRSDGRLDVPEELLHRAQRIRELVGAARSCIIEVGRELVAAKDEVGHGNWGAWLKAEFGWTDKTAQNYMRVFETFGKNERGSDLLSVSVSIDAKALYALAAPTVPSEVHEQAIERVEQGQTVSLADAERMVEKATHEAAEAIPKKIEEMRAAERQKAEAAHMETIRALKGQLETLRAVQQEHMKSNAEKIALVRKIEALQETITELQNAETAEPEDLTIEDICNAILMESGQKKLSAKQCQGIAVAIGSPLTYGGKTYAPAFPEDNRKAEQNLQIMQNLLSAIAGIKAAPPPKAVATMAKDYQRAALANDIPNIMAWCTDLLKELTD